MFLRKHRADMAAEKSIDFAHTYRYDATEEGEKWYYVQLRNASEATEEHCVLNVRPGHLTISVKVYDKMYNSDNGVDLRLGSG